VFLKVDFMPLSPEEIERIELEELKAAKALREKAKMER
jgi:hypothetical protein